jgi:hypothetical protein
MKAFIFILLAATLAGYSAAQSPEPKSAIEKLPDAAGFIDVTQAPYNADPSGKTDSTDALQRAFSDAALRTPGVFTKEKRAVQIIYLPSGTYRVSKPMVVVSKETVKRYAKHQRDYKKEVAFLPNPQVDEDGLPRPHLAGYLNGHIMLIGESPDTTRIVLADNSPAFKGKPVPLIRFLEARKANTAYFNWIKNLSINTGRGNPGAIAVEFICSNIGGMRNVRFVCPDREQPSAIGIDLPVSAGGLGYLTHIEIDGFKKGVSIGGDHPGFLFEDLHLRNQSEVGIENNNKNLTLRKVYSQNRVPALIATTPGAITYLLDSEFTGGASTNTAIINAGHLFARNIKTDGYNFALKSRGHSFPGGSIREYVTDGTVKLFDAAPDTSLNLPVRETPDHPWPAPDEWSIFDPSAQDDDTAALQALIDNGTEQIFIKGAEKRLHLTGTIHLRGKLKRLHGGWCNMLVRNEGPIGQPLFKFHSGAAGLMIFEAFSNAQHRNTFTTFVNASEKTVVIRDVFMGYGVSSYRNTGSGDLYLENVVTGGGDFPQIAEASTPGWLFKNQHVWFRNLNPEEWVPDIQADEGAVVFGLGGKVGELYGIHLKVVNHARVEIFGLKCNTNRRFKEKYGKGQYTNLDGVSIEVENAELSLGVYHDGTHQFPDPVFIREQNGDVTKELSHTDARQRKIGSDVVAPLYRSKP